VRSGRWKGAWKNHGYGNEDALRIAGACNCGCQSSRPPLLSLLSLHSTHVVFTAHRRTAKPAPAAATILTKTPLSVNTFNPNTLPFPAAISSIFAPLMSSRFSSSFLRVGLPFISFMVLGSFGLSKFLDHKIAAIDARKRGKDMPQKIAKDDANDILQSIQKSILVGEGSLQNKPIARPPGL
jgi:hypothetical protein